MSFMKAMMAIVAVCAAMLTMRSVMRMRSEDMHKQGMGMGMGMSKHRGRWARHS